MIQSDTFVNPSPRFRVLSDSQSEQLFKATLDCLQQVGVQIHNAEARTLLANRGAKVDDMIVYIPEWLVRRAIESTPLAFSVWGRDGNHEMRVAMDRVHFGPGPTCTHFIDPYTKERRLAKRGDAGLTAKVCDALPNIDYIMGLSFFSDVNPVLAPVYEFAEELINTTKPIIAWAGTPETLQDIYRMAVTVAGSEEAFREKPNFAFFTTYESPLRLADEPLANLIFSAEHGIPSICLGGPTVGLESPFTGASALVLYLASALAALTVVQLKQPGVPMAIGGLPSMMDLRTARPSYGAPETSLFSAAAADLARYLGLPFMGTAGASESKALDAQAGSEATMEILISALSGASLVHDIGFLDCADIGSLGYLVLTDELIGMVARFMRGVQVDSKTILFDLIKKVGPGGSFIKQKESVSLSRSEVWIPSLFDRNTYNVWEQKGGLQTEEMVWSKLQHILETHQPAPLSSEIIEKIEKILKKAETRVLKCAS